MRPPILNGVMTYADGRQVCAETAAGRREYDRRIRFMVDRQFNRCCLCGQPFMRPEDASFEHEGGRGMGGARRDDRLWLGANKPLNGASHGWCNAKRGSKRTPLMFRGAA